MSLRFGEFELDEEQRRLFRSGRPVPLEPRAYELLSLLVQRRPRVLSRSQIRDAIWPGTFVSESTLGAVVSGLRQALGDDARQPRFIRTAHGFGYAFCAEALEVSPDRGTGPTRPPEAMAPGPVDPGHSRARGVVAASVVLAVVASGWLLTRPAEPPAGPVEIAPFTTDGGFKDRLQLSPDGARVAYSWAGPDSDNWDIYVKAEGVDARPLRLTRHPGTDWAPAWSPDGKEIAFVRVVEGCWSLYTVPSLGGEERRLSDRRGCLTAASSSLAVSWSPDGRWLAFVEKEEGSERTRIVQLSVDTLEERPLTSPPADSRGDCHPAFSPDGTRLAFVRSGVGEGTAFGLDVWIQPLNGGEPRQLTRGSYQVFRDLSWTPTADAIVFTAGAYEERILRVSLEGGEPQLMPGVGGPSSSASVRAGRMAFVRVSAEPWDIWRVPGRTSPRPRVPERLIASSQADITPAFSPDGRRIAFMSFRSGAGEVWTCAADGSSPLQLTRLQGFAGTPRWSPDGRQIVFDSVEGDDWNLHVIDARGGAARKLVHGPADDIRGAWSPDGEWLYFVSNRSGRMQIWRSPPEGGLAEQVTERGALHAHLSWDGETLYFVTPERAIWRRALDGGHETEVVSGPIPYEYDWALSRHGLYYATEEARIHDAAPKSSWARVPADYAIRYLDFETGDELELFRKDGAFDHQWLAVSPDEEWILFGEQALARSEIMLMDGFR